MIGLPASDRAYYAFYAKCVELRIPLSIHTSHNWTRTRPGDLGHPRHIDEVGCRFPELVVIMSHAGYPWVLEARLTAWKLPNVYLELAAHRPRDFAAAGTGWEPLMRFGQKHNRRRGRVRDGSVPDQPPVCRAGGRASRAAPRVGGSPPNGYGATRPGCWGWTTTGTPTEETAR